MVKREDILPTIGVNLWEKGEDISAFRSCPPKADWREILFFAPASKRENVPFFFHQVFPSRRQCPHFFHQLFHRLFTAPRGGADRLEKSRGVVLEKQPDVF